MGDIEGRRSSESVPDEQHDFHEDPFDIHDRAIQEMENHKGSGLRPHRESTNLSD